MAGPFDGKTYIIEMSSSQSASGYAEYLVPPLLKALDAAGLKQKGGPGADIAFNVVTKSDVGRWVNTAKGREWLYTVRITVGISPESYVIPFDGTPKFGAELKLVTPNGDREDELACMITLAAKTAISQYKPSRIYRASGQSCLRKE